MGRCCRCRADRALADTDPPRDLPIGQALGGQPEHPLLPVAGEIGGGGLLLARQQGARYRGVAVGGGTDRGEQVVRAGVRYQIADRAAASMSVTRWQSEKEVSATTRISG